MQPCVQVPDFFGNRLDLGPPGVFSGREHGADDRPDACGHRQLGHRDDVFDDVLGGDRPVVLRQVVRPGEDHHRLRVEVDHVGPEAAEHLGRDLAADSAAGEIVRREEFGMGVVPSVGDRVAHEHHRGRGRELRIGFGIAAVVGPVALLGRQQGRKCERDQQNQFFHGGRYFF